MIFTGVIICWKSIKNNFYNINSNPQKTRAETEKNFEQRCSVSAFVDLGLNYWKGNSLGMLNKIIGFGIVGIIATAIDFASLFVLKSLLGVNVYIAATVAFLLALVFNYAASMKYVFVAKEGLSVQRQVAIFLITAVIGLLINQAVMYAGIEWLGMYYMLAKFLATGITMVFNFVARHMLLEK